MLSGLVSGQMLSAIAAPTSLTGHASLALPLHIKETPNLRPKTYAPKAKVYKNRKRVQDAGLPEIMEGSLLI